MNDHQQDISGIKTTAYQSLTPFSLRSDERTTPRKRHPAVRKN
jgi:hypothetical protein